MANIKNTQSVKEITEKISKSKSIFFTDYLGLDVSKMTSLRGQFYEKGLEYQVAKNTLIKIALQNNNLEVPDTVFRGSTGIVFSYEDPTSPAKIIKDFHAEHELPEVKGFFLGDEYFAHDKYLRIADLPSKDVLLAMLLSGLSSPLQKFNLTIKSPMISLVGVLNSLKQSKQ